VESDGRAAQVIRRNIAAVGLPGARLVADRVERVVGRGPDGRPRDFVFADPPYGVEDAEVCRVLAALLGNGWLAPGALIALERSTRSGPPTWPPGYEPDRSRRYGEATLWYGLAAGARTCCDTPTGE
jgi:16S rRNA (guanine966-N2)-methyltransferase